MTIGGVTTGAVTTGPTFRQAWHRALYGPGGFYRRGRGAGSDFATPSSAPAFLAGVRTLAERVDAALGHPDPFDVVDLGAGPGRLLAGLAAHAPPRWRLTAVEVRPRPAGLPRRIRWRHHLVPVTGLLLAVEWLDVIPCPVLHAGRVLRADGSPGGPPGAPDRAWLDRWWPSWRTGGAECGRSRDRAWHRAAGAVRAGLAVAVDYGHLSAGRRPTLTGYRQGRQVAPRLDAGTDITAHVALDSLPGHLLRQREALGALGVRCEPPRWDGDPARFARAWTAASQAAEAASTAGFGGFGWVLTAPEERLIGRVLPEALGAHRFG